MPTRKIRDIDTCYRKFPSCRHPEHDLPSMMVFRPGEYEHECPGCGNVVKFTVYPSHWLETDRVRPDWRVSTAAPQKKCAVEGPVVNTPSSHVHKWARDYDANSLAPASAYGRFCIGCNAIEG